MSVSIELPPEVEARVRRLAEESGLTPSTYVRKLIEDAVLKERGARAAALLAAWDEEDRTDDPREEDPKRGVALVHRRLELFPLITASLSFG